MGARRHYYGRSRSFTKREEGTLLQGPWSHHPGDCQEGGGRCREREDCSLLTPGSDREDRAAPAAVQIDGASCFLSCGARLCNAHAHKHTRVHLTRASLPRSHCVTASNPTACKDQHFIGRAALRFLMKFWALSASCPRGPSPLHGASLTAGTGDDDDMCACTYSFLL